MTIDLLKLRLQKIKDEIESSKHLDALGIHPLEAADQLTHLIIEEQKSRLKKEHSDASDAELIEIMQQELKRIYPKRSRGE